MVFSDLVEGSSFLHAKLDGVIRPINIAIDFGWNNYFFLLEIDSILVILVVQDSKVVPWNIKIKWLNTMVKISE